MHVKEQDSRPLYFFFCRRVFHIHVSSKRMHNLEQTL